MRKPNKKSDTITDKVINTKKKLNVIADKNINVNKE